MNQKLKNYLDRLPDIFRYAMVLGVVVFISLLFPNNVKFKYAFERGQTWRYNDLHAPFDFPILKTPEEIVLAKTEISKNFSPYYQILPEVLNEKKASFKDAFESQKQALKDDLQFSDVFRNSNRYIQYGNKFLEKIYEKGVVQIAPEHLNRDKGFVVNVVKGNTYKPTTLNSLWDVQKARENLTDSLPYSRLYVPEFLLYILPDIISPNLYYNDTLTSLEQNKLLSQIVTSKGVVQKGELIIPSDGIVTDEIFQKLVSFKAKYEEDVTENKSYWGVFVGYFLLTSLILGVFMMYVQTYAKEVFKKNNSLIFILLWFLAFSYLVYSIEKTDALSSYIVPFCIVPIVIKHFFSERLAFFTHIVIILIASFLSSLGYEFTFIQILAGIVAVLTTTDARHLNKFFLSLLYLLLTYAGAFLGLNLIQEGSINTIDWSVYVWIFLNVFLTLLAFPLIPLIERVFGFTSSISLVELSDMTRPLLKDLALKAPGTLQHSLQVANLSEAAANEIGADPLLVKVAALYHDIGKMQNPGYFIENQSGKNPHDELSNLESAKMIIGHVAEGIKLAKKHRLPKKLVDFIKTHHGTTKVEYFYRNHLKENPKKGQADEHIFQYPGPRPKSKEETILMIADSLEAASKSLKEPAGVDIDNLVDKIVAFKIQARQFEESEMTFEELEKCKLVFKLLLRSINHVRVEYPEEEKIGGKK